MVALLHTTFTSVLKAILPFCSLILLPALGWGSSSQLYGWMVWWEGMEWDRQVSFCLEMLVVWHTTSSLVIQTMDWSIGRRNKEELLQERMNFLDWSCRVAPFSVVSNVWDVRQSQGKSVYGLMSSRLGTIFLKKIKGLKMKLMKALDINSYKKQKSSFIVE